MTVNVPIAPGLTVTLGGPEPEPRKFLHPNEAYLAAHGGAVSYHDAWWGLHENWRNLIWFADSVPRKSPELLCQVWSEMLSTHLEVWLSPEKAVRLANFSANCIHAIRVPGTAAGMFGDYYRAVTCTDAGEGGAIQLINPENREILMKQWEPGLACNFDSGYGRWLKEPAVSWIPLMERDGVGDLLPL